MFSSIDFHIQMILPRSALQRTYVNIFKAQMLLHICRDTRHPKTPTAPDVKTVYITEISPRSSSVYSSNSLNLDEMQYTAVVTEMYRHLYVNKRLLFKLRLPR